MPVWLNVQNLIKACDHINTIKGENNETISSRQKKALEKIQCAFVVTTFSKGGRRKRREGNASG